MTILEIKDLHVSVENPAEADHEIRSCAASTSP